MFRKILKYGLIALGVLFIIAVLNGEKEKAATQEDSPTKRETITSQESGTPAKENEVPAPSGEPRINILGWTDSPYITPDGQSLYFMYSRYNFYPIFTGGQPILQVPEKAGHHNNDTNPWDDSDLYVAHRKSDGTWGVPENLSFNDTGSGCCAMIAGNSIYYQNGAEGRFTDIVYRERNGKKWGKEINLGLTVNSTEMEDNPHVSADEDELWFTSTRPGGMGGKDIWYSKKVDGEWTQATNPGAPLNSAADEDQIWISEKDGTVYLNRDGIYQSKWNGSTFTEPKRITLDAPSHLSAEVSITDAGEMFFANLDPQTGRIKIYSAKQKKNGSWGPAIPVD